MLKQLAERDGDGIVVQLLWDDSAPAGSDVVVEYSDERQGVSYTLYPPSDRALEVFHHPNAYMDAADARGTVRFSRRAPLPHASL